MQQIKIEITSSDQAKAGKFARECAQDHCDFGKERSLKDKFHNVYIGKLGEIIFEKTMEGKLKQGISLDSKGGADEGFDAIGEDDVKYDIKTLDSEWKNKVYINHPDWSMGQCDAFVAVKIDEKTMTGTVLGICPREVAKVKLKHDEKYFK